MPSSAAARGGRGEEKCVGDILGIGDGCEVKGKELGIWNEAGRMEVMVDSRWLYFSGDFWVIFIFLEPFILFDLIGRSGPHVDKDRDS